MHFFFAIIGLQSNAVLSSTLIVVCCIQKGFWGTAFDFYPIIYYWTMFKKHEIPGFDFEFHLKFQGLNICMGLIMWSLWSTKIYKHIVLIPMIEMALNSSFWIIYTLHIYNNVDYKEHMIRAYVLYLVRKILFLMEIWTCNKILAYMFFSQSLFFIS